MTYCKFCGTETLTFTQDTTIETCRNSECRFTIMTIPPNMMGDRVTFDEFYASKQLHKKWLEKYNTTPISKKDIVLLEESMLNILSKVTNHFKHHDHLSKTDFEIILKQHLKQ